MVHQACEYYDLALAGLLTASFTHDTSTYPQTSSNETTLD